VRLFVAVNLPRPLRGAIFAAGTPLRAAAPSVRWVDPEGLHLTLKFLGEVADGRSGEIVAALERACAGARPFPLEVGGFGAFPTAARARVVWVGCEAAPPLELLQHGIEREFAALGFPVEGRPFRPHLTLGRAKADARGGVRGLEDHLATLVFSDTFTVASVDLMESTLTPRGARYAVRHAVALG
jgi:2'-5' RNA ligase